MSAEHAARPHTPRRRAAAAADGRIADNANAAAGARRYERSELAGTCSEYLCPICYGPLYVDIRTGREFCFNAACVSYVCMGEVSGKVGDRDGPREAERRLRQSVLELRRFSPRFLRGQLYLARRNMCVSLLRGNGLCPSIVAAIDYLLTQLGSGIARGGSEDGRACRSAFEAYYNNFSIWQFVETLCSRTFITTPSGMPYVVKYYSALELSDSAHGIVSAASRDGRRALYAFSSIDAKATGEPGHNAFDFEKMYRNAMPLAVSLNRIFKSGPTAAKIHKYPSMPEDVAALRSLWETCRSGRPEAISRDEVRKVYYNAVKKSGMRGDFDQFLRDYASGETYAPVLVFDGKAYRFDYPTMFLYLVYINSNNRTRSGAQAEAGALTYGRWRQNAARHFEDAIHQKLRTDGFDTHPKRSGEKFSPSFDNKRREFDCVAVDRKRKIIVLVEAKYRDIPPSSAAGEALVDHLVLDKRGGLLGQARDHHSRRQFFIRNFDGMKERGLGLEGCFLDYTIHAVLVTKHVPLISRHKSVRIVSYGEFLSIDFRGGPGGERGRRPSTACEAAERRRGATRRHEEAGGGSRE